MVRKIAVLTLLAGALPTVAGEMTASEARHFVVDKLFSYTCFDGTHGQARVYSDGSVIGSLQFQDGRPARFAALPAGTLRLEGERVCASLRGLPIQPCFYLERTDANSFRGSISGLRFAYCDFRHYQEQVQVGHSRRPLQLRPTPTDDNNERPLRNSRSP